MKRRAFLKAGSLSGLATLTPWLPMSLSFADETSPTSKTLVCVFMRGAADGLSIVPPLGDADYFRLRPTLSVPDSGAGAALVLDSFFGLHPSMQPLLPWYESGDLAIVHASGLVHDSHSHFDAQALMEQGVTDFDSSHFGWLGRYLGQAQLESSATFRALAKSTAVQRSLSGETPVMAVPDTSNFGLLGPERLQQRLEPLLENFYQGAGLLAQQGQNAFASMREIAAIDLEQFPVDNEASYPATDFGRHLAQLSQLIKAEIGVECACVDIGGWDHHDQQLQRMPVLLDDFAGSLAAFATDLGQRMDNVTVVCMSEFGRRAYENASGGTDHGHGNALYVLGGAVNGGQVYGSWPGLGNDDLVFSGDLAITTDYRHALADILNWLEPTVDLTVAFPDLPETTSLGLMTSESEVLTSAV